MTVVYWNGGTWCDAATPTPPQPSVSWGSGQAPPFDIGVLFTSVVFVSNFAVGPDDYWSIDWHDGTPPDTVGPIQVGATQTRAWHYYPIVGTFPPPTATYYSGGVARFTQDYPHAPEMVSVASGMGDCAPVFVTVTPRQVNVEQSFQLVNGCDGLAGDILRVQWGQTAGTEDIPATVGPPLSITPATHTWTIEMDTRPTVALVRGGVEIASTLAPTISVRA